MSNAAPDICIAYKLHLECGRLINLYDWLEVRSVIVFLRKKGKRITSEKQIKTNFVCFLNSNVFFYTEET